jgi:hypothetical protein
MGITLSEILNRSEESFDIHFFAMDYLIYRMQKEQIVQQ